MKTHTHYICFECKGEFICERSHKDKLDEMKQNFGDVYPQENPENNNDIVSICDDCYESIRAKAAAFGIDLK